jgi:hypothetical protein
MISWVISWMSMVTRWCGTRQTIEITPLLDQLSQIS